MASHPTPDRRRTYPALAATLLLALAAGVYVLARVMADQGPIWGYVRAFAEAAMIGGLADWFAVTALFRRPLGLPIPHTAVIPKSQGRIADALGAFIVENFLAPDLVRARVAEIDLARGLGGWLAEPRNSDRVADGLASALPALVDMTDDVRLAEFLRRMVNDQLAQVRLAPLAGGMLSALAERGRHQGVIDLAIDEASTALIEHEGAIRDKVKQNTGWLWRLAGLDSRAADALIGALDDTLREIAKDRQHPFRRRVTDVIARFAHDLVHSGALQDQWEQVKTELLAHPSVTAFVDDLGAQAKDAIRRAAAHPDGALRRSLAEALASLGQAIAEDAAVRDALNERLRALAVELSGRLGPDVARLVSQTIRDWDSKTVVAKLEQNVGADLQYIRISGTLIGGLVGLALHAVSDLWGAF